jgi:ADP-heptose:LPS heptosyltransferase
MNISKKLTAARKKILRLITRNIGKKQVARNSNGELLIKSVLICRPNHRLGNLLMLTPLVQEINNVFPDCTIDIFAQGKLAVPIFQNYPKVEEIIPMPSKPFKEILKYLSGWAHIRDKKYDLVINADPSSSSGRIATKAARGTYKFFGDQAVTETARYKDYKHMAKQPVYNFRLSMEQLGFKVDKKPVYPLDIKLTEGEILGGKKKLDKLAGVDKRTIALFTHATGDKCYPASWWDSFFDRLKERFPHYQYVEVLPLENISKISFRAPTFSSKNIREVASFIANTELVIAADGGVMHLASAARTTVAGFFSITDKEMYEPYSDHSVGINTNSTDITGCLQILEKILFSRSNVEQ